MLQRGFEWTLQHGLPANSKEYRVPPQPACCQLALGPGNVLTCNSSCWRPL